MSEGPVATESLVERVERKLAVPVLIAALLSVPAVFLSMWATGAWRTVGVAVNATAGGLMWVEWLVLLILAEDKWAWLKRNKWTLVIVLVTIPAVVFSLGPAQLLRIVYSVSTLRVLRVRRIIKAGRVMQRRLKLRGWVRVVLIGVIGAVSLVFIGVLILDPNSDTWVVAELITDNLSIGPAIVLGVVLAIVAAVMMYNRRRDRAAAETEDADD